VNEGGEQRWPPWFGPLGLVAGLLLGIFGGVIVDLIAHAGGASLTNTSAGLTDLETVVQDLGFIVAAVYLASRIALPSPAQFGLRLPARPWRAAALVAAGLLAFYLCSLIWFSALHTSGTEKTLVKEIGGNSGTLGILAACAVTCVVAPLCEEFLFRGFIFAALRNWRGPWPAAAITGVLFGVVHGLSAPAVDLLPLAFLGFVLCVVYQRSGSLYPCIALHLLNNTIAFGSDEHWEVRIVELTLAALAAVALVLYLVRRLAPAEASPVLGRS
jgi:membrane protease YdiL (CAAX protease family)